MWPRRTFLPQENKAAQLFRASGKSATRGSLSKICFQVRIMQVYLSMYMHKLDPALKNANVFIQSLLSVVVLREMNGLENCSCLFHAVVSSIAWCKESEP